MNNNNNNNNTKHHEILESPDINLIKSTYPELLVNSKLVFKSSKYFWIVVLEKTEKTKTNESRDKIAVPEFAWYRGSEFKVVKIFNKFDPSHTINSIENNKIFKGLHNNLTYTVGEIVSPSIFITKNGEEHGHYDEDMNNIHSYGIHYFKTMDAAFYYDLHKIPTDQGEYTGKYYQFFPNGKILMEIDYYSGKYHGKYIVYYTNGLKDFEYSYTHGEKNGMFRSYLNTGEILTETNYFRDTIEFQHINNIQKLHESISSVFSMRFNFGIQIPCCTF